MKKALLLVLALLGLPLLGLEAQTTLDLVNEVYAGRNCRRSALMESLSCQYRVGEDLDFEIANVGDPEAFLNVWSATMTDGDFFIGTTPLHDPGDELIDYYPCIVIKPGTSNPTYMMIVHHVYVSPRTGDVYESQFDCKTDGEKGQSLTATFELATASNEYEELVLSYLDVSHASLQDVWREEGFDVQSIFHSSLGALEESERDTISLALPETEAVILTAVCDDDCSDVDLILLDPLGNILDEDTALDDTPALVTTGPVQVVVSMVACSVEPCFYALGVFQVDDSSLAQDPVSGPPATGQALEVLRSRAEQGDAEAQYNLGVMYQTGSGAPQDYGEAVRLYRLAADQGYAPAQSNLGVAYQNGSGVPQDDAEAVRLYRLAADQGYALAQNNLGFMYANGAGVPVDATEAMRWFTLAAEQGDAGAQSNLGFMYANGAAGQPDFVLAHMWSNLASAQGSELAQENKNLFEQRMTREEIAEAQRLSREWIEAHPPGGN